VVKVEVDVDVVVVVVVVDVDDVFDVVVVGVIVQMSHTKSQSPACWQVGQNKSAHKL